MRLTTTDTLVQGVLGPMIADFSRRYPGIHLEVVAANPFFSLSKRDADIALRPTRSPPESLVGRKITDVATAVYGATAYLAKAPSRQALEAHIWVAPDDSLAHLPSAQWLRKQLPIVSPVVRCNGVAGMLAAARAGVGLAALPCFLGDAAAELERVHEPLPELTVGLWLLTHPDLRRVPRIRAVLDHLHKSLEQRRPQFLGMA